MITKPHARPFTYPVTQEYAELGLDPSKIELLCLFDQAGNLYDASGNERHGDISVTSGFSGTGRYGTGMFFDKVDDLVSFGDILNFSPATTPFSVSVWVDRGEDGVGHTLCSKKADDVDTDGWLFIIRGNGTIRFKIADGINNITLTSNSATVLANGYAHVVATYDGSQAGAGIKIYKNGILVASTALDVGVPNVITTATEFQIAGLGGTKLLLGSIDNTMIYSDVLTPNQISNLYNKGL